jgi:predicted esterase
MPGDRATIPAEATRGRLRLPPAGPPGSAPPPGLGEISVDGGFAGLRYVPATGARRLVVLLHGAGGTAEAGLKLLLPYADEHHLMLYAPQSAAATWDVITGGYGPDVHRLQQALDRIYAAHPPFAARPVLGGFSDGGSYALSLGLINGDVCDAVLAFSPGFAAPTTQADHPAFFVSHGRADTVLPIDRCSRRIVRTLEKMGYPVRYHEFDGGHVVPGPVVAEALGWLAGRPAGR